jgi:hypothetical protein
LPATVRRAPHPETMKVGARKTFDAVARSWNVWLIGKTTQEQGKKFLRRLSVESHVGLWNFLPSPRSARSHFPGRLFNSTIMTPAYHSRSAELNNLFPFSVAADVSRRTFLESPPPFLLQPPFCNRETRCSVAAPASLPAAAQSPPSVAPPSPLRCTGHHPQPRTIPSFSAIRPALTADIQTRFLAA